MFSSDFMWDDIFLSHYLWSLIISVFIITITFVISKWYIVRSNINQKIDPEERYNHQTSDLISSEDISVSPPMMKKSPALAAEKVIQANMTEEQRKLEHQVRQKQLAQIYELMTKQSDKFGKISLSDVEEQMKLYQ